MRHGLINLGSNAFRLLIVDGSTTVVRRSVHLGLARSVGDVGHLQRDDIATAEQITREFVRVAADYGVTEPTMVATEAFRAAGNGMAALDHIGRKVGQPIRLLSGSEQATLVFGGAMSRLPDLSGAVVAHLDGGSLCVASGDRPGQPHAFSHQLGVHLLGSRAVDGGRLSKSMRVRLEAHITGELRPTERTTSALRDAAVPCVLAGSWASAIAQVVHTARRGEVPADTHGFTIDCADLGHLIDTSADLPTAARLAIPGMKPRRAELLPLAASVLRQVLRSLGYHEAICSGTGLEDGILRQHRASRAAA